MSAAGAVRGPRLRAAVATAMLLGVAFFPAQSRAGLAVGGVAALETSGDAGLWYGPTVSWWAESFLGLDVDLRFGEDRGASVMQVVPWIVAFTSGESLSPYLGAAPAIVDVDGSPSLETGSLYLKVGARWRLAMFNVFAQATTILGDLAPDGVPLGLEAGIEFRFGDQDDTDPETPRERIPRVPRE